MIAKTQKFYEMSYNPEVFLCYEDVSFFFIIFRPF